MKTICRPLKGHAKFNEVELKVTFSTGSTITLYGADNPDSLRGITLNGVVFDEYSQHPANIYSEIIQYTLSTTGGYAIWIGTPKGKNQLYEEYQRALQYPEEHLAIFRTIEDTIAEETGKTVDQLKKHLEFSRDEVRRGAITEDEFRQELYCSFDASVKGAYYAEQIYKARAEDRIRPVPYDPSLLVYTVWDLGISDAMAIGFYQKDGVQVRMIDYYEDQGKGLNFYINVLRQKNYTYGSHFAPHDISQRELSTGRTRLDAARELGITFNVVPNIPVADGIDSGRRVFNKTYFDAERTADFLDKLSRYHKKFDDKKGIYLDRPDHDDTSHAADVHRYMSLVESEFANYDTNFEDYALYQTQYT